MEKITCGRCGAVDKYTTEMKSGQNVATCTECGRYIKNIPQDGEPTFHFGKYKGKKVAEVEDMAYLKWLLKETKPGKRMKEAIEKQIAYFENLAR